MKPHPMRNFAPEVFDDKLSTYSDIYSFGYVIWEVFNRGGHPLDSVVGLDTWDSMKSYKQDKNNEHDLPLFLNYHKEIHDVSSSEQKKKKIFF